MKIGIDARLYRESGNGRYIRNLINSLGFIDKKNSYYVFLLKKDMGVKLPENFTKVAADFRWYSLAEQIKFPLILYRYNLDLVHIPHFNIPILYLGKFVVTIHDLIHQHFFNKQATTLNPILHRVKKLGYDLAFKCAAIDAKKILTPSKFVKDQLIKEWGVSENKIEVTYEGVDDSILRLARLLSKKKSKQIVSDLGIKSPYLFYVGNAHPHKNVESLINCFKKLKVVFPQLSLVLSGSESIFWKKIKNEYKFDGVVYTGFVSDETMVALYKNALAFVTPSLEEGFGLPILEAMAVGTPVVTSDRGSLKEVGGEAALYFNPEDREDIFIKLSQVITDSKLRSNLVEKGKLRYLDFNWKNLADKTLKIYQQVGSS